MTTDTNKKADDLIAKAKAIGKKFDEDTDTTIEQIERDLEEEEIELEKMDEALTSSEEEAERDIEKAASEILSDEE